MMSSGEGTAISGTSSGSPELSEIRKKLNGDLVFKNVTERKVTKRSHKVVKIIAEMEATLEKYPQAFNEDGEVLLKGDERKYGSFKLAIPDELVGPFLHVAVTDPTLVPPSNGTSKVVDQFASNVSKRFNLTIKAVKEFLNKDKELKGLLEKSVVKFGDNPPQDQIVPYDFGANDALYTDKAIEDYQRKQFNAAAPERNDVMYRIMDGLLQEACEDAYNNNNHVLDEPPTLQDAVKKVVLRIWAMAGKSNDDLVSILKADEPLCTTMADDPSLAGRLSLQGAVEYGESEDLEPGTLLEFIALCLRKDESLVESEVMEWTTGFATKYNQEKERVAAFNEAKEDDEVALTAEHWPFHRKPHTPYNRNFITCVIDMMAMANLDPRRDYRYSALTVESFVKRVARLMVELDTSRATATSSTEA